MNMPVDEMPGGRESDHPAWMYFAGGMGALLIGFVDLLKSGSETTSVSVLRIREVLIEHFHLSPDMGGGWAVMCLAVIAMMLVWAWKPTNRKESFSIGLSVFAILSTLTPYPPTPSESGMIEVAAQPACARMETSFLDLLVPAAFAAEGDDAATESRYLYYFTFDQPSREHARKKILLTIYNEKESRLLGRTTVPDSDTVALRLPVGSYVMHVECPGCDRVRVNFDVEPKTQASRIKVADSRIPLSLQRLVQPSITASEDLGEQETAALQQRFETMRQMPQAAGVNRQE